MDEFIKATLALVAIGILAAGVVYKTENDRAHVIQMKRQADAQVQIAKALKVIAVLQLHMIARHDHAIPDLSQ